MARRLVLWRVAVMGDSGVGKTALTTRYSTGTFNEAREPSIETFERDIQVDGNSYGVEIFDTAGWDRDEWSEIRYLWIMACVGFILTFSTTSRASFNRVKELYRTIRETHVLSVHGKLTYTFPAIVLAGTKADLVTEREVPEQEGETLARSLGVQYVDVSSKQGDGVEMCFSELFQLLERKDNQLKNNRENHIPILPRPIARPPSSWFDRAGLNQRDLTQVESDAKVGRKRIGVCGSARRLDHMILRRLLESSFDDGQPTTTVLLKTALFRNEVGQYISVDGIYYDTIKEYGLEDLVEELEHIALGKIYVDDVYSHTGLCVLGRIQNWVESKTGVGWDWHPLPSRPRRLDRGRQEVLIRWICSCGDERWAIAPQRLVERAISNSSSFSQRNLATGNAENTAKTNDSMSSQPPHLTGASPGNNIARPTTSITSQSATGSLAAPARSHTGLTRRSAARREATSRTWVALLVRYGYSFRLRQLDASSGSCHDFFVALRSTYFSLRGQLRAWFSVWQYSHCDFYMCEKFEENEFSPTQKDSFPDISDYEYQFTPRPMDLLPPISKHEFYRRFYTCFEATKRYYLHHTCKVLRGHSDDVLHRLPKRTQELELDGDKRERFWGLYAREAVSLQKVLLYNAACMLPVLAFFFAWLFGISETTDLQGASVPIGMMAALLSLFWSLFLSSLQFGRPH